MARIISQNEGKSKVSLGKCLVIHSFICVERRIFYCENIEKTTAWGAFLVKYLLGRTGNMSNDKKKCRRIWVNII